MAKNLGIVVLVPAIAGYYVWRRRKKPTTSSRPVADTRARERLMATSLYEQLEAAMSAQGIARGASTPPLQHAEALKGIGHPLAGEVLELTELYLHARFGGRSITDDDRRTFETRVKRVRAVRAAQQQAASV